LTIETTGDNFISISLEKLVTEDTILSEQEWFEKSNLVEALLEKTVVRNQNENNYIAGTN